ncbi:MAG TPA: transposase, partial [Gaiellaceae bacterium]|nr:transposase [Gaiellaceae bacterium]
MPRPRYLLPSPAIYHVTTRGVDRMRIAHDAADYTYVHRGIVAACFRFGWTYFAHCVMPNHFHIVVETSLQRLSVGMKWLNFRVARR